MAFTEQHRRTVAKTISYRVLITISTAVIVYGQTKSKQLVWEVTTITAVVSTVLYYIHERAWSSVHWGKVRLKK
jgi:uncharacterized membrane protein